MLEGSVARLGVEKAPYAKVIDRERELGALVVVDGDDAGQHGLWPLAAKDIRPMREVRREYAARALELHAGNYTVTARALGIAVNTLKAYLAEGDKTHIGGDSSAKGANA